jgi:hypothetical protein
MDKRLIVTQSLHLGGLALVLVGLAVACEQEPSKSGPTSSQTGGSGGTGSGGTGGLDAGLSGEGGADDEEVRKGERGSSCDSSNDCEEGLSCIVSNDCPTGVACANKSCQPSNFEIMGTGKQCHVIDCATTEDCCGDKPLEMPEKCVDRERICSQPTLLDCSSSICTSDTVCGSGTCPASTCSLDGEACQVTADCELNTCNTASTPDLCSISGADCSSITCTTNLCPTTYCDCTNPDYDPENPICSDPDCEGICGFACEEERCVVDDSCDIDADCVAVTTPFCDDSGTCVECLTSEDCGEDEEVECVAGRCGPECEVDTQCALFEACQANECVYVGCQSNRECVLSATDADPTHDPRLAKCNVENGIGTCVFPCEIDAQCAPTEVCLEGVCEYIGCETDGECKTIAGLHNTPIPTEERPWVTTAVCRAETPLAP